MNYKIILIILLILFLLGNYFRESFTDTDTHHLLAVNTGSIVSTDTFQLTNIISRSASGDTEDDFKNLYTLFGQFHFNQDNDYEQGQLPILVLESYNECPTLHTLYKSLKKLKTVAGTEEEAGIGAGTVGTVGTGTDAGTAGTAGTGTVAKTDTKYEQNENVEGYRFRSLIQSVFYNITEPIEVDYKLFDMFVEDKFKEDLSNNQPNLKLKLSNINNYILINKINSKIPISPSEKFKLHNEFEINIELTIINSEIPENIDILKFENSKNNGQFIKIELFKNTTPTSNTFSVRAKTLDDNKTISEGEIYKYTHGSFGQDSATQRWNPSIEMRDNDIFKCKLIVKKTSIEVYVTRTRTGTVNLNEYYIKEFENTKGISSGDYTISGNYINQTPSNYINNLTFSYQKLNTELSYLDSVQPQYAFNHKEATFGVQENFERIDILRFMDFAFTTLCWGALHINLLKPLDNHFYAFPCQNNKCNTTIVNNATKPHFFYLLPVKVRQICYEEGSEYTRAKCNGCASNIIVFFNQVPNKFKNLSNINQTDQNKSITLTELITLD